LLQEQVDLNKPEEPQTEKNVSASETNTPESHEKAYVKCILVKAGLYENQMLDSGTSRWDMLNKPIPKWVFDKVEELFTATDIEEVGPAVSHKMLFDLTNEVLIKVLPFKKWYVCVPHSCRLLDELWNWIERSVQPRKGVSHTLDDLICKDLKENTWYNSFSQELN
jgi:Domain of unknown function (DUF4378)